MLKKLMPCLVTCLWWMLIDTFFIAATRQFYYEHRLVPNSLNQLSPTGINVFIFFFSIIIAVIMEYIGGLTHGKKFTDISNDMLAAFAGAIIAIGIAVIAHF